MTLEERIQALPPDKRAVVIDFIDFLMERAGMDAKEPVPAEPSVDGLIAMFGTIDFDPAYDYKKARGRSGAGE